MDDTTVELISSILDTTMVLPENLQEHISKLCTALTDEYTTSDIVDESQLLALLALIRIGSQRTSLPESIVYDFCIPALSGDNTLSHSKIVLDLLAECFEAFDNSQQRHILGHMLKSLRLSNDAENEHISTKNAVTFLDSIFDAIAANVKSMLEDITTCLLGKLSDPSIEHFRSVISVLLKVLRSGHYNENMSRQLLSTVYQNFENPEDAGNALISSQILCIFADYVLPQKDIQAAGCVKDVVFWRIIQTGLVSEDTLTRKRCMYLMKRVIDSLNSEIRLCLYVCDHVDYNKECLAGGSGCHPLFAWNPSIKANMADIWVDVILVLETLEETQVHVIKPILPRIQGLILATESFLPTSWLAVIFKRFTQHESTFIYKLGMEILLKIDLSHCPMFGQSMQMFYLKDVMDMLKEISLYYRVPGASVGSLPPICDSLTHFFQSCYNTLPSKQSKAQFFQQFLAQLNEGNWGGVQLYYVTSCLSSLPTACKILNKQSLGDFSQLLLVTGRFFNNQIKSGLQYIAVKCLTKLVDLDSITPDDLLRLLPAVYSNGCSDLITGMLIQFLQSAVLESTSWGSESILSFLEKAIGSVLSSASTGYPQQVSYLVLLCIESGVLEVKSEKCSLESLLSHMVQLVTSMNRRAYLDHDMVDRVLDFVVCIWRRQRMICVTDRSCDEFLILFQEMCAPHFLQYITRRLLEDTEIILQRINLCCNVVMLVLDPKCSMTSEVRKPLSQLAQTCLGLIQTSQCRMQAIFGMKVIQVFCIQINSLSDVGLKKYMAEVSSNLKIVQNLPWNAEIEDKAAWRELNDHYLSAMWSLVEFNATERPVAAFLETCLNSLCVQAGRIVVPIMRCIQAMPRDQIIPSLQTIWKKVVEEMNSPWFGDVYETFLRILCGLSSLPSAKEIVEQICFEILKLAEDRLSLAYHFAKHYLPTDRAGGSLPSVNVLVDLCSYGPMIRKNIEVLNDVYSHMETIGLECADNRQEFDNYSSDVYLGSKVELDRSVRDDFHTRAHCVAFLLNLQSIRDSTVEQFLQQVIRKLMSELVENSKRRNHRNFPNSVAHRLSHRLVSALLIMEPAMKEENLEGICSFIMDQLSAENHASVRLYTEWLTMRLLYRYPAIVLTKIWGEIGNYSTKKPATLCSLLTILAHAAALLGTDQDFKVTCLKTTLTKVLPWCMAHHFNVRIHAQASLNKIWNICVELGVDHRIEAKDLIINCIEFSLANQTASKTTDKLLDNFFFFTFSPVADYTLETVYCTLPRLLKLAEDEWIRPSVFKEVLSQMDQSDCTVALENKRMDLSQCKPGAWRIRETPEDISVDSCGVGDVQKKIVPWCHMLPDEERSLEFSKKRHNPGGLVVVASLIDKIPNLGGLCRTSEIFGASNFVISNLKSVEDKTFQSLSVTAHKWIPIAEVPRHYLKAYFAEMKADGYTLVGAEQTVNSRPLNEYTFPKKTLLVLGNEKEGIPVDMIQSLDACVEIPQRGIIRSLNVHVSGALLIWEYTRQHLTTG